MNTIKLSKRQIEILELINDDGSIIKISCITPIKTN